ncbi:MAG TPA: phosphoribosyltransferase family protein [Jatrophihabitantaceae bacterium]|nr:phosphoribosyltransferase family protein [Jatrophihabitantaceae bacterium]
MRYDSAAGQHRGERSGNLRPSHTARSCTIEGKSQEATTARFANRRAAGQELGALLAERGTGGDVVVLGLPRGGLPVAAEVAAVLEAPLDLFSVRKLGVPGYPELALGAVATGGVRVLNDDVLASVPQVDQDELDAITERALAELRRREAAYRGGRPPLDLAQRTAILVDDGLATGATMRAAVSAARQQAAEVVVAAPVASWQSVAQLEQEADDVVIVHVPKRLGAVGAHYDDFRQVGDDEVCRLLC